MLDALGLRWHATCLSGGGVSGSKESMNVPPGDPQKSGSSGDGSGPPHNPGHRIVAALEAARGWLQLLAVRQLPPQLRTKVAASDLVQKTILEAYLDSPRFEGTRPEELYGWLRKILRNNVHDCIRQFRDYQGRDVRVERPLDELDPRERDDPSFIGDQPPELSAIRAEEDSALGLALAKLPDTHRMIVRLRCWDKLEWDDIGRRVGRSGGAARKIWGRSIVRLRAELK